MKLVEVVWRAHAVNPKFSFEVCIHEARLINLVSLYSVIGQTFRS
jgi:hypothetical protein